MKPTDPDIRLQPLDQPGTSLTPVPLRAKHLLGLRPKFVLLFSLILIIVCSTLSGYYVEARRETMTDNLLQLGSILLTSVVRNEHFQYAGIVAEDHDTLQQFIDSLLAVQCVVYVVITRPDGTILAQHTKGSRQSSADTVRSSNDPLYPEPQIVKRLFQSPQTTPLVTGFPLPTKIGNVLALDELVYDFAMPVLRRAKGSASSPTLSYQLDEAIADSSSIQPALVSGTVQIGLTDVYLKQEVAVMIRDILIFTALIIAVGAFITHLLTLRITRPLRSLAAVAQQVAEGRTPPLVTPASRDEVGQLTNIFNLMTSSLKERNAAISGNMATIEHQVGQLTTLHQVSAAIARTLDLKQILHTVLELLITNLGFTRMFVTLRHRERDTVYVAHIAGVTPDIAEAARRLEVPIRNDGGLQAELLLHGKSLLIPSIEAVADRINPPILELARQTGVTSFVAVPLQSQNQTLGYLAGDRGSQRCTEEDLHVLLTIAGHVAAAIDNANAYAHLEELTQHLESRIAERTQELTVANDRLQEHDRQRSLFLSVASHELRTPMTVIRSFADNMRDGIAGPVSEQQVTYLDRIGHNLSRLTRIINQLLDWSQLNSKSDILHLAPVCIEKVAVIVADSLRSVANEKAVTVEVGHAEGLPVVQGDSDKLEQILWNLIGNAIKFTPPGGRITVDFQGTPEGFVQTSVADTGCGIDTNHLGKLFVEFSKVTSAIPAAQGAQLGLFITKSLVNLHHGTIWVESTPGAGTRFFFTVPVAASKAEGVKAEGC